ncbi:hypothetical protein CR513_03870, partial [Mucuna pruriens]
MVLQRGLSRSRRCRPRIRKPKVVRGDQLSETESSPTLLRLSKIESSLTLLRPCLCLVETKSDPSLPRPDRHPSRPSTSRHLTLSAWSHMEKKGEQYAKHANKRKRKVLFKEGDLIWVHLRKERYLSSKSEANFSLREDDAYMEGHGHIPHEGFKEMETPILEGQGQGEDSRKGNKSFLNNYDGQWVSGKSFVVWSVAPIDT